MHVYIQIISLHLHLKGHKGEFMLHQKTLVGAFYGFCDNVVFYITAIDIIVFKASISSGNFRFSHKSGDLHKIIFKFRVQKSLCDIPAVNAVDHILYTVVSGAVKLYLPVLDVFKRNFRVGQGKLFH